MKNENYELAVSGGREAEISISNNQCSISNHQVKAGSVGRGEGGGSLGEDREAVAAYGDGSGAAGCFHLLKNGGGI